MRARVEAARKRQRARYGGLGCNATLSGDAIQEAANATPGALRLLTSTLEQHNLSGRAWARILKVARTIADLEGVERVDTLHIVEASAFRLQLGEGAP